MSDKIKPDWKWIDDFGDTLEVYGAGENLVLAITPKHHHPDADHPAVSLGPEQLRGLRAALGVHLRRLT